MSERRGRKAGAHLLAAALAIGLPGCGERAQEGGTGRWVPKTLRLIGEIADETHSPIPYQAAVLSGAEQPEAARAFVEFLAAPSGREALKKAGLEPAG
jgi:hypothetical protein